MSKSNQVAIVTGASRGLGAVIAQVLAERGCDLVLGGRDRSALSEVADFLRRHVRVAEVIGDVATAATRAVLVDEARRLGPLHVLVNNASELGGIESLVDADLARLTRILDVNLVAPIALVQQASSLFVPGHTLIVNITSDAARGAYPGWGFYGSTKAALELASATLAAELRDRGTASVIVDPGDMRTRMHQEAFAGEDISDRPLPDVTVPFWNWLFTRDPLAVSGQRFGAQQDVPPTDAPEQTPAGATAQWQPA